MVGRKASKNDHTFAVLNPSGLKREVRPTTLSVRTPDLNGKFIYCVSQHAGGADVFLKKVSEALPKVVPAVKAIYKRRETAYMTDDPELWSDIAKKADAVIYGCSA
jgi:hypothetical protein